MTRYIDADVLIDDCKKFVMVADELREMDIKKTFSAMLNIINTQPTADAAPIRRGTWSEEYAPDDDLFFRRKFRCSACGGWNTYGFTKYCPECGAYMERRTECKG